MEGHDERAHFGFAEIEAVKIRGIKSREIAITAASAYSDVQNEIKQAARDL
jgi:hypothetical protein